MGLFTGIDIIEIERIKTAINRHGERFLKRIYTQQELADCADRVNSLAARFAAKESVAKALGCGIGEIGWHDIEILRGEKGEPILTLYGKARERADSLGISSWSLSISHNQSMAIAIATALNNNIDQ